MDTITARRSRVAALKGQVEARLLELAPSGRRGLAGALHHALSSPGKRLRPLLVILTAVQLGQEAETALDVACALEMVHAASLVLDDLPCMDDATLRRDQPCVHVRYGQDVAVLAGVALLNQAYALIARCGHVAAPARLAMVEALTAAVGPDGLVGGQEMDLHDKDGTLAGLREAHHKKTGVLFLAAVTLGGLLGGANATEQLALERFAADLGLAFQARDDIVDAAEAQPMGGGAMGMSAMGAETGRRTLVSHLGRPGAMAEAERRLAAAKRALAAGGARLEPLGVYVDLLLGERSRVVEAAPA